MNSEAFFRGYGNETNETIHPEGGAETILERACLLSALDHV
jgi:hypothetical protein